MFPSTACTGDQGTNNEQWLYDPRRFTVFVSAMWHANKWGNLEQRRFETPPSEVSMFGISKQKNKTEISAPKLGII